MRAAYAPVMSPKPEPTTRTVAASAETVGTVTAIARGCSARNVIGVNVENAAYVEPPAGSVRMPKRAPSGASSGRVAVSVVENDPSAAMATAPRATPPIAATSSAFTAHRVPAAPLPTVVQTSESPWK